MYLYRSSLILLSDFGTGTVVVYFVSHFIGYKNIIYIYLITTQKSNTEYLFHSWCNFDLENINEGHRVYHSYPNLF
jgi:hypothetical protein